MSEARPFRIGLALNGVILGLASMWLLCAELSRPGITMLPTSREAAKKAAPYRNDALWAARFGTLRGDLWAELAFTYAELGWGDTPNVGPNVLSQAKASATRAISLMPSNSAVWLLVADLAWRYKWQTPSPVEALKMSYYTGPDLAGLAERRLTLSARIDDATNPELDRLFQRQLETILTSQPSLKPVVLSAYSGGTPHAKDIIADVAKRLDPATAQSLLGTAAH